LRLTDRCATGSSLMPAKKKNPDVYAGACRAAGKTGRVSAISRTC